MKTRLSDNTTTAKKVFYNVILKCFQNHCHLLKSYKQTKAFFLSEPEVLSCFELNYKFLERHKKPLSLATTRKQENAVNTAQKIESQSSTEATTEEVPGSIVTYIGEEINTFKDDVASENTKKGTPLPIVLNRGT